MALDTKRPGLAGRASAKSFSGDKADDSAPDHAVQAKLAREAATFIADRETLKGPAGRDHFIIDRHAGAWRLTVRPAEGAHIEMMADMLEAE